MKRLVARTTDIFKKGDRLAIDSEKGKAARQTKCWWTGTLTRIGQTTITIKHDDDGEEADYPVSRLKQPWCVKLEPKTKRYKDYLTFKQVMDRAVDAPAPVKPVVKTPPTVKAPAPAKTKPKDTGVPAVGVSAEIRALYIKAQKFDGYMHFMKPLWLELNKTKFKGALKLPNFRLLKDMGTNMRLRGQWSPSYRTIAVAPRLFKAELPVFLEIFLHEMCHQAVSEIDKVVDVNRGHGPYWSSWMRKVGLNPSRYDRNDNTTYMDEDEKEEFLKEKKQREEVKKKAEQTLKKIWYHGGPPQPARALINGKITDGLMIGYATKGRDKIAFIGHTEYSAYPIRWWSLPQETFYEMPADASHPPAYYTSQGWLDKAQKIREAIAKKLNIREERKAMRSLWGY